MFFKSKVKESGERHYEYMRAMFFAFLANKEVKEEWEIRRRRSRSDDIEEWLRTTHPKDWIISAFGFPGDRDETHWYTTDEQWRQAIDAIVYRSFHAVNKNETHYIIGGLDTKFATLERAQEVIRNRYENLKCKNPRYIYKAIQLATPPNINFEDLE